MKPALVTTCIQRPPLFFMVMWLYTSIKRPLFLGPNVLTLMHNVPWEPKVHRLRICTYVHIHTYIHTYIHTHTMSYVYILRASVMLSIHIPDGVSPQNLEVVNVQLSRPSAVLHKINTVDPDPTRSSRHKLIINFESKIT